MRLYHYSDINIEDKLKVDYFGFNYYTFNDKKISDIKRLFFFINEDIPEFRFKHSRYKYIAEIEENLLYNLIIDNQGLISRFKSIAELLYYLSQRYKGCIYNLGRYNVVILFEDISFIDKIKLTD